MPGRMTQILKPTGLAHSIRYVLVTVLFCSVAGQTNAQFDGPRVYWPLPKNTNIVATHLLFGNANAALDNWEFAQADASISSNVFLFTFTAIQPVLGRTANWMLSVPAGQVGLSSTLLVQAPVGNTPLRLAGPQDYIHGIGDPSLSGTINLFGAPGLKAREFVRYDLETVVSLQVKASFPIGQYDANAASSLGSNQYKLRIALPVTHSLGDWVPGRRLALDVMPSIVLSTANDDYKGQKVESDPAFAIETHLSRDLTKRAFLSLDYSFLRGGGASYIDSSTGTLLKETDSMNAHLLGMTVNFQINDNLQLFLTHLQTVSAENNPVILEGSVFKATLSWGWHVVLQKVKDFHG